MTPEASSVSDNGDTVGSHLSGVKVLLYSATEDYLCCLQKNEGNRLFFTDGYYLG